MSPRDREAERELDELLDPVRLAAAWQAARAHAPAVGRDVAPIAARANPAADAGEAPVADEPGDGEAPAATPAATSSSVAVAVAPLPVAVAHRRLADELDRTLAEVPGLAAAARPVLAGARAQLAAALDPLDVAAAEAALDTLEDLVQSLLMTAGWPARREE